MIWWGHFLASFAFSLLASVVPFVVHAEAYAIGAGVLAPSMAVAALLGLSIGQTVGKVGIFLAIRHGRDLPWIRRRREQAGTPNPNTRWGRFRLWTGRVLTSMAQPQRQVPVLILASTVGIPPLYAAALYAPTTKMRLWVFTLVVLVGSLIRFAVTIWAADAAAGIWKH